jgi:hypothetical protein
MTVSAYERLGAHDAARIFDAADAILRQGASVRAGGPADVGSSVDASGDAGVLGASGLQWLIPVGQAYLLTDDERYASGTRSILESWVADRCVAGGDRATMPDAALRIVSWTWLFHVFCRSRAWAGPAFRLRFLCALFRDAELAEQTLERQGLEGSHVIANAVGTLFAGLFFDEGAAPRRWAELGWNLLRRELPRHMGEAGAAAAPTRCQAIELFFMAARYREALGLDVPDEYRARVIAMARVALADAQSGRSFRPARAGATPVLPFGGPSTGDQHYLPGLIGAHWSVPDLIEGFNGRRSEILWALGPRAVAILAPRPARRR